MKNKSFKSGQVLVWIACSTTNFVEAQGVNKGLELHKESKEPIKVRPNEDYECEIIITDVLFTEENAISMSFESHRYLVKAKGTVV